MKIIEKEVLHEVQETMDESEFLPLLGWNSIKAFITMAILAFTALVIVPAAIKIVLALFGIAEGAPITLIASIIATTLVFCYVFHVPTAFHALKWFIISVAYSVIMYIGGELIFMAMLFVGIIITVIFLVGDVGLTGLYTYIDLKTWVEAKKIATNYEIDKKAAEGAYASAVKEAEEEAKKFDS